MARIDTLANFLTDVATAIKNKTGKTDAITPANFDTEIESIETGGGSATKYAPRCISFYGYTGTELTEELENLDISNMTTLKNLFNGCTGLTNIDLSIWDTSHITSMERLCNGCTSLTNIDFINNIDLSSLKTTYYCFFGCTKITSAELSLTNTGKLTTVSGMFFNCSGLTSLIVNKMDTSSLTDMSALCYSCSKLVSADLSNLDLIPGVFNAFDNVFYGCKLLSDLKLPSSLTGTETKPINFSYTFYNCVALTEIDLSQVQYARAFGNMFRGCTNLTKVDLSNMQVPNDGSTSSTCQVMFSGCTSLQFVDVRKYDFANYIGNNIGSMLNNVPTDCVFVVADDTQKEWCNTKFPTYTNVKTVAEYEAEQSA